MVIKLPGIQQVVGRLGNGYGRPKRRQHIGNSFAAVFVASEPEQLALYERPADCKASFLAMERSARAAINASSRGTTWIAQNSYVVEWIRSRQVASTEVHVAFTVHSVGPGFGDHVHDQAAGL